MERETILNQIQSLRQWTAAAYQAINDSDYDTAVGCILNVSRNIGDVIVEMTEKAQGAEEWPMLRQKLISYVDVIVTAYEDGDLHKYIQEMHAFRSFLDASIREETEESSKHE